ncbi:hypothetical protein GQ600_27507 [Phytophthora cactorum]|nr:hypothetical protein GQ600_27507 [Phytophthora cactorum]
MAGTLRIAVRHYKDTCPSFASIACILIGKDYTEIAGLEEEFPSARILLYHFQVAKALRREVASEKFNVNAWTKTELKQLCRLLVTEHQCACTTT